MLPWCPDGRRRGRVRGHILTPVSSTVALCCAAVLGLLLALLSGCGQVAARAVSAAAPLPPAVASVLPVDLLPRLAAPMACGRLSGGAVPLVRLRERRHDFTGDGVPDAVVAVRCDTGAGNPPSAVFAVLATPNGPAVQARLVDARSGEVVRDLRLRGADLSVASLGYSANAPRCCPDLRITRAFHWDGQRFAPRATTRLPN
jgi:hypothetical protein